MNIQEIITELCKWLLRNECAFMLASMEEMDNGRVQVTINQIRPEQRQRIFTVLPADISDCWNVVEVE